MQPTDITIVLLFSIFIGFIVFFSKPTFLMFFVLIFVYLLPRAGFLLGTGWYQLPLPLGYVLIAFIVTRWIMNVILRRDVRTVIENPIRRIFPSYIIIATMAIIIGLMNGGRLSVIILETLFYFAAFLIFFATIDIFGREDCIKVFIPGVLICAFLVSLYGLLILKYGKSLLINYVTYNARTYASLQQFLIAKRTLSTYGDPNTLGAQLIVFSSIYASLLLEGRHNIIGRVFLSIGFILTLTCTYLTSSRASLIGLFVLLLVFAVTKVKKVWFFMPILVLGYIAFIEPIRKFYEHRIFQGPFVSDVRMSYIDTFFNLLGRFPLGVGFGVYPGIDYNIRTAPNIWYGFNSFYLHFFSRTGIQGLAVFGLILFFILRYLFKESNYIKDPNIRYFVFGGACGLIAQQFNFITNNIYQVPGGMLNFWIMCGMLTIIINIYKRNT